MRANSNVFIKHVVFKREKLSGHLISNRPQKKKKKPVPLISINAKFSPEPIIRSLRSTVDNKFKTGKSGVYAVESSPGFIKIE